METEILQKLLLIENLRFREFEEEEEEDEEDFRKLLGASALPIRHRTALRVGRE